MIHLFGASQEEIELQLCRLYTSQSDSWVLETNSDSILYIRIYEDQEFETDHDPEELERLLESLGGKPDVSIIADVSGRHGGDQEVKSFVNSMLSSFKGVARDEYTYHSWTLEEINSGTLIQGHPFFDYRGWYESDDHWRC
ncbi:MAG TPA: hypothetical protein VFD58_20340 [Blastocatellia bacterium]|nr:hypothetical protein [Blastocatellia bacterium]